MKINDDVIIGLKKEIEERRKELPKTTRFNPITNCSLNIWGVSMNVHTMDKNTLVMCLVYLNSVKISATDLELLDDLNISGFPIDSWISDLRGKLEVMKYNEQLKKLKVLEEKLIKLLSLDKRVELEIEELKKEMENL